jgi:hypothetical protein
MRHGAMAVTRMSTTRRRSPKTKWMLIALGASVLLEVGLVVTALALGRQGVASPLESMEHPLSAVMSRWPAAEAREFRVSEVSTRSLRLSLAYLKREATVGLHFAGWGSSYIVANVGVSNTGPEPLVCEPSDFSLVDSEQRTYPVDVSATEATGVPLQAGELAPRQSTIGFLTFRVPADAQELTLLYQPPGGGPAIRIGSE